MIQCRAGIGTGTPATKIQVKGENWPDNSVDPDGADHNDYFVRITGQFAIENSWEIFATEDQEIDVKFQLGSTGATSQTVRLSSVDCDGNAVTEQAITQTSGSTKISVKKGDRFNLHTRAVTNGKVRNFDLLGDKGYAYELHIIE